MQRCGYGHAMVEYILRICRGKGTELRVGTGDSPITIPFYEHFGFQEAFRIPNFFREHYDHPIYESGKLLTDMVYLSQRL